MLLGFIFWVPNYFFQCAQVNLTQKGPKQINIIDRRGFTFWVTLLPPRPTYKFIAQSPHLNTSPCFSHWKPTRIEALSDVQGNQYHSHHTALQSTSLRLIMCKRCDNVFCLAFSLPLAKCFVWMTHSEKWESLHKHFKNLFEIADCNQVFTRHKNITEFVKTWLQSAILNSPWVATPWNKSLDGQLEWKRHGAWWSYVLLFNGLTDLTLRNGVTAHSVACLKTLHTIFHRSGLDFH